jgi:hypothetical protein
MPGNRRGYERTDGQRQAGYSYPSGRQQRKTSNHLWMTSSVVSLPCYAAHVDGTITY